MSLEDDIRNAIDNVPTVDYDLAARKLLRAIDNVLDEIAELPDTATARRGVLIGKWAAYTELLKNVQARRRARV